MISYPIRSTFFFKSYKIQIQEQSSNKFITQITNPDYTKIYLSELMSLKNISIDTIKVGLSNSNQSVKIEIKEKSECLKMEVLISVPLLPSIMQSIVCPLHHQVSNQDSNRLIFSEIQRKMHQIKEKQEKLAHLSKSQNTEVSYVQLVKQLDEFEQQREFQKGYDNSEGEDDDSYDSEDNIPPQKQYPNQLSQYDGTLRLGQLKLEAGKQYLLTLSFFGRNFEELVFLFGNANFQTELFSKQEHQLCWEVYDNNFSSYIFRERFIVPEGKNGGAYRLWSYPDDMATEFRNVVLTAEQLTKN